MYREELLFKRAQREWVKRATKGHENTVAFGSTRMLLSLGHLGTAKYGVRDREGRLDEDKLRAVTAHDQVRMFELKLAQGAKPGKGGILPGLKVTKDIAAIRGIDVGADSISPNCHMEVSDAGELLDMVAYLREITGKPVGVAEPRQLRREHVRIMQDSGNSVPKGVLYPAISPTSS